MASVPTQPPTADEQRRIDAARAALDGYKQGRGLTWATMGDRVGRAGPTLSLFAAGKYTGDNFGVAVQVERFLDADAEQDAIRAGRKVVPGYVETPFSEEMIATLRFAQSGEIVAIAAGPGCGKTITANHYRTLAPNVWLATLTRSTARLQPMQIEVLKAMGDAAPKGSPQQLSAQIKAKMDRSGGLLIVDEFHEATDDAIEELRSWHDATGIGLAFVGDYRVIARIEGRREQRDRAQIFSRLSKRMVRHQAHRSDAEMLLDAWDVTDPASRAFALGVAAKPGALRAMTKMLKLAAFADDGEGLTLAALRAARGQLTTQLDA